jgi:GH25 family lysozyme M1 (1,4-beta-N-acetylmuramidase)
MSSYALRKSSFLIAIALVLSLIATPAQAAKSSVTMKAIPASFVAGKSVKVSGKTAGSLKGAQVRIQIKTGKSWKTVKTVTSKKKNGTWTATFKAPKATSKMSIRAISGSKKTKVQAARVLAVVKASPVGPSNRILGLDVSRWQSSAQPIDFTRMAAAGVSFAFIKGSDGLPSEDVLAVPHVTNWAPSAKAAGILVGYYHFARIPVTTDSAVVIADAQAQAAQAAARLASLGGYDDRTLPYVLDIERVDAAISRELVTLWTFTWLDTMQATTGRTPIIYSYRSFLSTRFLTDAVTVDKFRNYHLWLAQPGNPADPASQVGEGLNGAPCYVTPWKQSDCSYVWSFWQYTTSGDRETYGIPWQPSVGSCPSGVTMCFAGRGTGRSHLDLNVFNGSATDLSALVNGSWVRTPAEYR